MLTPQQIKALNAECDRWVVEAQAKGVVFSPTSAELMSLYSKQDLGLYSGRYCSD